MRDQVVAKQQAVPFGGVRRQHVQEVGAPALRIALDESGVFGCHVIAPRRTPEIFVTMALKDRIDGVVHALQGRHLDQHVDDRLATMPGRSAAEVRNAAQHGRRHDGTQTQGLLLEPALAIADLSRSERPFLPGPGGPVAVHSTWNRGGCVAAKLHWCEPQ